MVVVNGHFDGKQVVLDSPVPEGIPANTRVRVVFDGDNGTSVFDEIAKLAKPGGFPQDYSRQHEHYNKGAPRR
jgi:hypothetical protein